MSAALSEGWPEPLGATVVGDGVNFAVFSAHATAIDLCLYAPDGAERRRPLTGRTGDIWHGFVPGIGAGQAYGYRAAGPWDPATGHLFNPAKCLIDPYAREISGRLVWHPAMSGQRDGRPDPVDSAAVMPKSLVTGPDVAAGGQDGGHDGAGRPALVLEGHVRDLTVLNPAVAQAARGTYAGLADPALIRHLRRLGVSHLELLPVTAFIDDHHVCERGLTNHWGYQPVALLAPEPRYQGGGMGLGGAIAALAAAGIGTILDVVFNHTGEGDMAGPTLSFRGLDNKSYYRLDVSGAYLNDAGTGNTLNLAHPMVLRLVLDAMRRWVALGVAGFRFDLAVTLTRDGSGFAEAVIADPVLSRVILIAEPWDIGPDPYRLGRFPPPFLEWNDRFRDDVRRFWRGDGRIGDLASRLAGSADPFDRGGRSAAASVNFIAAHDGMTLADVVTYARKHNLANGEDNRDGHYDDISDNFGTEGPDAPAAIQAARARRLRAMLATLFVAQGTPMLLAGDELGRTQKGNNNAYAQDNAISHIDWAGADGALEAFVARLSRLRRDEPALRQDGFLHGTPRAGGRRDLVWRLADGREPGAADWARPDLHLIGMELAPTDDPAGRGLYLVFNRGNATPISLPPGRWQWQLDSAAPDRALPAADGAQMTLDIPGQSVQIFIEAPAADSKGDP